MISGDPQARAFFIGLRETLVSAGVVPKPPLPSAAFDWFQTSALRRLDQGAREYRNSFRHDDRNLADEAIEETLDVAIYALLEITKSQPDSTDAASLGQAVYFAYKTYEALLDYKAKLRGAP